nr:hypothetical protein [Desulfobacula sp.]
MTKLPAGIRTNRMPNLLVKIAGSAQRLEFSKQKNKIKEKEMKNFLFQCHKDFPLSC